AVAALGDHLTRDEPTKVPPGQVLGLSSRLQALLMKQPVIPVSEQPVEEAAHLVLELAQTAGFLSRLQPAAQAALEQPMKPLVGGIHLWACPALVASYHPGEEPDPGI